MVHFFLTLLALTPICAPTFAGNYICWIDHVTTDASGVRVFFNANAGIWGQFGHRSAENEQRYMWLAGALSFSRPRWNHHDLWHAVNSMPTMRSTVGDNGQGGGEGATLCR